MKKKRYLMLLAIVGVMSSCNKWLDITPEDTTVESVLFEDRGGYYSAINGIYQSMSQSDLYGKNLTWGFTSALSQYYDNYHASNSCQYAFTEKYDYESNEVKAFGEQIWKKAYNVIANCNNVIQHIDKADASMFPYAEAGEMDMIRGEALAARALMHFEVLRLFADAPVLGTSAKSIPYSTTYPNKFPERVTTQQALDGIESDLLEAASLLAVCDSLDGTLSGDMNTTSKRFWQNNSNDYGLFFSARGVRLNFVAVKSLLARFYAYAGDMESAYACAKEVYETYVEQEEWYGFSTPESKETEATRERKMMSELLVAMYDENLSTDYNDAIASSFGISGKNPYMLKNVDVIFGETSTDVRKSLLVGAMEDDVYSLKYKFREGTSTLITAENNTLPIMRISELVYIMAEYEAQNGDLASAIARINAVKGERECTTLIAEDASLEAFMVALNNEIWRENIAEGQYFYYCKRTNAATINNQGVHIQMSGKYTMLTPDSQISF